MRLKDQVLRPRLTRRSLVGSETALGYASWRPRILVACGKIIHQTTLLVRVRPVVTPGHQKPPVLRSRPTALLQDSRRRLESQVFTTLGPMLSLCFPLLPNKSSTWGQGRWITRQNQVNAKRDTCRQVLAGPAINDLDVGSSCIRAVAY